MRWALAAMLGILAVSGCKKEDMYTQAAIRQWDRDPTAANGSSMRPPVAGTLAREQPDAPAPQPPAITAALVARGQARYDIFCAPCHGATGAGDGMIVQRGFPHPPPFTDTKLLRARAQMIYDTITYGHGAMYSYAARVPPADRWAIAAYVRALQFSQAASVDALPPQDRQRLAQGGAP